MKKKKIVFVSHCVLNRASKVVHYIEREETEEEVNRKKFIYESLKEDIDIIQLPCPEFNMYGSNRWGHTKEQFDNPFFREKCREMLKPYITQMKEYLKENHKFSVLGIVGIDGSPSCGVNITCVGPWGGEFSGRENIQEILKDVSIKKEKGVFMEVLHEMLTEENIKLPLIGLNEAVEKLMKLQ